MEHDVRFGQEGFVALVGARVVFSQHVPVGQDAHDAGNGERGSRVHPRDAGVRVRREHRPRREHPGKAREVIGVAGRTLYVRGGALVWERLARAHAGTSALCS